MPLNKETKPFDKEAYTSKRVSLYLNFTINIVSFEGLSLDDFPYKQRDMILEIDRLQTVVYELIHKNSGYCKVFFPSVLSNLLWWGVQVQTHGLK